MDRPFEAQGVAPGRFSVVYAVNTVHVARDLHATLAQVLRALEPGGHLVLSECVRPQPGEAVYAEFIFNLMERFRAPVLHPAYRPNGGFLTPEQWRAALEAAGFAGVQFLPDIAAVRDRVPGFFVAAIGATRPR
jgi:SAM-dependent methyltransferase